MCSSSLREELHNLVGAYRPPPPFKGVNRVCSDCTESCPESTFLSGTCPGSVSSLFAETVVIQGVTFATLDGASPHRLVTNGAESGDYQTGALTPSAPSAPLPLPLVWYCQHLFVFNSITGLPVITPLIPNTPLLAL